MGLGNAVKAVLDSVGVTPERVARYLGGNCGGCEERQAKLNALGYWAAAFLRGRATRTDLERMMDDDR